MARRSVPSSWPTGLIEVGANAYAYVQGGGGTGISNAGLIVGEEGLLVIDSLFLPPMTQAFLAEIRKVSRKPVRHLVITHHHVDHTLGNQYFVGRQGGRPSAPTQVISHENCRQEMIRVGLPLERLAALMPAFADQFRQTKLVLPDLTYRGQLTIHFEERVVELLYLGAAHTIGDTLVYLPQDKLLFAGDIAFHYVTPLAFEGHVSAWIDAVRDIEGLEVETIVPGHGPVGGKAELREMRDYLTLLRREARKCHQEGMDEWQAARAIRLKGYSQWANPERVLANVRKLYQEFRSETPTPLDAEQTFRDMQAFAQTGVVAQGPALSVVEGEAPA
ncbi:MAG: MBL fold metallo-hydrolase [Chloroflexota bacterium]|nr:MBL fold metallo-hydrolase [Chloroflexota bacterium]